MVREVRQTWSEKLDVRQTWSEKLDMIQEVRQTWSEKTKYFQPHSYLTITSPASKVKLSKSRGVLDLIWSRQSLQSEPQAYMVRTAVYVNVYVHMLPFWTCRVLKHRGTVVSLAAIFSTSCCRVICIISGCPQ